MITNFEIRCSGRACVRLQLSIHTCALATRAAALGLLNWWLGPQPDHKLIYPNCLEGPRHAPVYTLTVSPTLSFATACTSPSHRPLC